VKNGSSRTDPQPKNELQNRTRPETWQTCKLHGWLASYEFFPTLLYYLIAQDWCNLNWVKCFD